MAMFAWLSGLFGKPVAAATVFEDVAVLRAAIMDGLAQSKNATAITPDQNDPAVFTAKVKDLDVTLDVSNLFGYLRANPDEDPKSHIDRFVRSIFEDKSVTEQNLVAAIRNQGFVDYKNSTFQDLVTEPLVGDLHLVFMADLPDSMMPVAQADLPNGSPQELHNLALNNVRKWLPKLRRDNAIMPIVLFYIEENTFLSSSLILLDDFWKSIEAEFSNDVYFAVPRKDQLFVLSAANQAAVPALRKLIDLTIEDGFNLLSPTLFRYRNGKFEVA